MGLFSFLFGRRRPKRSAGPEVMQGLRTRVLQLSREDLSPDVRERDPLFVLMETGYPQAVASLVVVADGTTSLYFSTGGGVIGAGEHEAVRAASERFLAKASQFTSAMAPTEEYPLPDVGRVRMYVRTGERVVTAEAAEQDLGENRHGLSPLFHAGHEVITAIRLSSPG